MESLRSPQLLRELSESFLLFAIAGLTLGGYLGLALVFVGVLR